MCSSDISFETKSRHPTAREPREPCFTTALQKWGLPSQYSENARESFSLAYQLDLGKLELRALTRWL